MNINYLVRANSCIGLVNKIDSNISGVKKLYCLHGSSQYVKTEIIATVGRCLENRGNFVQYLISPFCESFYDGMISDDVAVVDKDCITDENSHNHIILNTDEVFLKSGFLPQIQSIKDSACEKYDMVYELYKKAKIVHDEWEKMYISNMDMARLNDYCNNTLFNIMEKTSYAKNNPTRYERFFGGAFSSGHIEYIDSITSGLEKRYFIKGRPGSGKSTFLKKAAEKSLKAGFDTEVYYCGFDPYSLDMVVVRDLSLCIFDSTSPHEKFPQNQGDEILDFYVNSGLDGTDEKYEKELSDIKSRYSLLMLRAKEIMEEGTVLFEKANDICRVETDASVLNDMISLVVNNF